MLRRIRDSIRVKRRNRKGGPASHRPGHGITAMTPGRAAAVAAGRDRRSKMLFRLHGGSALDVNKQLDVDAYERSAGASAGGPTEPAQKPMPEIDRRKMMLRISGGSALEVAKELDVDLDRDRSMPEETESRGETPRYAPQLKPLQPVMLRRPTSFKLRGRSSPPPARLGCKADARASEVEPQLSTAGHTQPWRKATNGGFANQNSRFMSAGGLNGKSDQSSRLFRPGTMSSLSASLAAVASSTVTSGDRGSTEPATPVRSAHKTVAELEHEAELDAMDAIADLDAELSAMSSPAYGFGTAASKPESPSYGFGPASITPVAARLGGFTAATCATDNGTVTPVRQAAQANRRASSAKQKTPKSKRHSLHAKPAGQFKAKQSPLHGRSPLGTIGNGRQNNRFNIGQKQLTQVGASAELATPLKPNPRAEAAAEWTNKEVRKLIEQIKTLGAPTVPGGQRAVRFGQLFAETENLFEALAGTCKTAKKYGVVRSTPFPTIAPLESHSFG